MSGALRKSCSSGESPAAKTVDFSISPQEFKLFRDLIHKATGIALGESKHALVSSRLARRLRHHGLLTYTEYYELVRLQGLDSEEFRLLINCITTNKTSFFRESYHFDHLRTIAARKAESLKTKDSSLLNVWSAACSTGEEAYSIAITLCEAMGSLAHQYVKILATDIDTNVLEHGRQGIYSEDSLDDVPVKLRSKYFLKGTREYSGRIMVKPECRKLASFERLNFVENPWPVSGRFDVIFCRNVLIYFDQHTQERVVRKLAGFLKPDGLLFVGHSENFHSLNDVLAPVSNAVYALQSNAKVG